MHEVLIIGVNGQVVVWCNVVVLVSGGLQQYLIRHGTNLSCAQPRRGAGSDTMTFHDLPV